jgi:hypothetical protein
MARHAAGRFVAAAALAAALAAIQCGGDRSTGPTPLPRPGNTPPDITPSPPQTLVGAGDIGWCNMGADQTARLVQGISGQVFTAGDNAYMDGSLRNFVDCYAPTWGRFLDRTRPVAGNHEYDTDTAARGYYTYFGAAASAATLGYYSYRLGDWHIIALNSALPGVGFGGGQLAWLEQELRAERAKCTAAIWHHPRFSSGPNGPNLYTRAAWALLYDADADIVINGHDHLYERFARQYRDGRRDPVRGIQQFTVGTGGAALYPFTPNISANSEVRISQYGVLKLTLSSTGYDWQFIPVSGGGDSGHGDCH